MSYPDERINEMPLNIDEYGEFLEHLRTKGKLFWDKVPDKEKDKEGWFMASQINHTHLLLFCILRTNVEIWRNLEGFKQGEMMTAKSEIEVLANYIMAEIPSEPSQSEGAGTTAVRIIREMRTAIRNAMNELGVPQDNYPAPVANAYEILEGCLR